MNAYRDWMGMPKGKRTQRKTRRSWKMNNEMDLIEVGLGDMDWIHLG
jgi:hypothetical protein